jgi:hypothetical protein
MAIATLVAAAAGGRLRTRSFPNAARPEHDSAEMAVEPPAAVRDTA